MVIKINEEWGGRRNWRNFSSVPLDLFKKIQLVAIFIDNHWDVNTYTANTNKDIDNFD